MKPTTAAKAFRALQAASGAAQANLGDRASGQTVLFAYTMGFMEYHKMVMDFTPAGKQEAMLLEESTLVLYVGSQDLLSKTTPHHIQNEARHVGGRRG